MKIKTKQRHPLSCHSLITPTLRQSEPRTNRIGISNRPPPLRPSPLPPFFNTQNCPFDFVLVASRAKRRRPGSGIGRQAGGGDPVRSALFADQMKRWVLLSNLCHGFCLLSGRAFGCAYPPCKSAGLIGL